MKALVYQEPYEATVEEMPDPRVEALTAAYWYGALAEVRAQQ